MPACKGNAYEYLEHIGKALLNEWHVSYILEKTPIGLGYSVVEK